MDTLNQLIASMNKEDIRFFKLYTNRINVANDRKDIQLFDLIRKKGSNYDEDKASKILYKDNKNAFYRLKNRLTEEINKSMLLQHFDDDEIIYIMHTIAFSKLFYSKNLYPVAFYFIRKAEKKAQALENYELLDMIYGEFIKLSHEIVSINPELYIQKRKENNERLNQLREIDDILSAVSYRMKVSQNFSSSDENVLSLLQKTVDDFSQDKNLKTSPVLRFRIYHAVSKILLQKHDYAGLESYLLDTYNSFVKENLFNKSNHDTKLQMLTYIANSLFKNGKLKQSLEYAEMLNEAMNEYNKFLYDKYLFFYYNSLVINYSQVDKEKAISILEELRENQKLQKISYYVVFIYLNLAVLLFDKKDYHNAIKNLNKFYSDDGYKNADAVMKFKIMIAELIIRYEIADYDYLEYKIEQLRKDYKEMLKKSEHERERLFISILNQMIVSDSIKQNKKLYHEIKHFIESKPEGYADDSEIIHYNDWLQSKL